MRMKKIHYPMLLLGGVMLTTSCVDDKYDLSDIDTTTAIKIDNLTVPVKLNTIILDDVLDIEEDGLIGRYPVDASPENQYYAIKKSGDFEADPIYLDMLKAESYTAAPSFTIPVVGNHIDKVTGEFSYLISSVDESLQSLSYFGLWREDYMKVNLTVYPSNVNLSDVEIIIPSTFTAEYKGNSFDNGIIPVNIKDGSLDEPIFVTSMMFDNIRPDDDRKLNITGQIGVNSASISGYTGDLTIGFSMSPFTVNVVSGSINYEVQAPEINPVELTDLPDFLTEGETNLILMNPQIYLNLGYVNGANYRTEMSIVPNGINTKPIENLALLFNQSLVLAADINNLGLHLYDSPTLTEVEDLRYILSGEGLPESINFSFENTYVTGEINDLILGEDKYISGGYTFFAPLSFAEGSQIIYRKAENDFFGDDMEDVKVSRFRIESDAVSELPADVTLTLYPLDRDGNRIQGKNGYVSASTTVAHGTSRLELEITEEFNGLDGVEYIVTAENMKGVSLSPSQTLTLNNIRATLSGEYITKL